MYADDDIEDHCTGKLGEHSKFCHGKSAFAISHNGIVSELSEISKTLSLTNDGWSGLVKGKDYSLDKENILNFFVINTN